MTIKVLFVTDKHVGSMLGLMPKRVKLWDPAGKAHYVRPSTDQLKLLKAWEGMIKRHCPVDLVIDGGDGCEGVGRKSQGLGIWSTGKMDQVKANLELLRMIRFRNRPEYVVADGSPYHTERNPSLDMLTAQELHIGMEHYGPEVLLELAGNTVHVSHKVGVSTSMYRATALSREKVMDLLTKDTKRYRCDLILRGHAHYFYQVRDRHGTALIGPCWQYRTAYMSSIGIALQPEIGYIYMEFDKNDIYIEPHVHPLASPIRRVRK